MNLTYEMIEQNKKLFYILTDGGRSGRYLLTSGIMHNIPEKEKETKYSSISFHEASKLKEEYINGMHEYSNFILGSRKNQRGVLDIINYYNDKFVFFNYRKNIFMQALSYTVALSLKFKAIYDIDGKLYHRVLYNNHWKKEEFHSIDENTIITVDEKRLTDEINCIKSSRSECLSFLKNKNIPYIEVVYEDILKSYETELKRCLDVIGYPMIDTKQYYYKLNKMYPESINNQIEEIRQKYHYLEEEFLE